jgi:hypothetical protein
MQLLCSPNALSKDSSEGSSFPAPRERHAASTVASKGSLSFGFNAPGDGLVKLQFPSFCFAGSCPTLDGQQGSRIQPSIRREFNDCCVSLRVRNDGGINTRDLHTAWSGSFGQTVLPSVDSTSQVHNLFIAV